MTSIESQVLQPYKYGFVTDIESDVVPPGLNEDIVRLISAKKGEPQWMLDWRLKAYRAWVKTSEPTWANVHYGPIDYQAASYYAAPKQRPTLASLEQVDPKLLETFDKLGIPLEEQKRLSGVAVDAVFDSVSVATTFREELAKHGDHLLRHLGGDSRAPRPRAPIPRHRGAAQRQLLRGAQLGRVLRWVVRLHPKGVRCPLELSTYFRINASSTGQFRAHADHRRRGQHRQLPRGLFRAGA